MEEFEEKKKGLEAVRGGLRSRHECQQGRSQKEKMVSRRSRDWAELI